MTAASTTFRIQGKSLVDLDLYSDEMKCTGVDPGSGSLLYACISLPTYLPTWTSSNSIAQVSVPTVKSAPLKMFTSVSPFNLTG